MNKNITDLNKELNAMKHGGKMYLPVGEYSVDQPIVVDIPCIKIEGEVWNYPSDPNGVFESPYGTKLKMGNNHIPAFSIGEQVVLGGNVIKDIGIQGNITGMDTRGLFDYQNPTASAGLCFQGTRVDQAEFSKLSMCGLASAVCVTGNAEIDACTFEKMNTDGCCVGFYFSPRASYYAMFRNCVVADTPSYGFFVNGEGKCMHHLDISGLAFVRNGGAFPDDNPYPTAALCFYEVSNCSVRNCTFDRTGTFWYYLPDAKLNKDRQSSKQATPDLFIKGNSNRIDGNIFTNGTTDAIVIHGDNNIIMNNVLDRNIVIYGNNNILINNVFTKEDAGIMVSEQSSGNQFINIPDERIRRILEA